MVNQKKSYKQKSVSRLVRIKMERCSPCKRFGNKENEEITKINFN